MKETDVEMKNNGQFSGKPAVDIASKESFTEGRNFSQDLKVGVQFDPVCSGLPWF